MADSIRAVNGRSMIKMEIVHTEGIDKEDMNKRLVDAEFKIWNKVEDIAYAVGKHPDEVYADLVTQFSEFIEKEYPTKYPQRNNLVVLYTVPKYFRKQAH